MANKIILNTSGAFIMQFLDSPEKNKTMLIPHYQRYLLENITGYLL